MTIESPREVEQRRRPTAIALLSLFFVLGTFASGLTVVMLLLPGSSLDLLWRLNPRAHQAFADMGPNAVFVMSMVCWSCAVAAVGLWRCRLWGFWTAICLLSINLLGDTINSFFVRDWRL